MNEGRTYAAVQAYLDELAGAAEPVASALLARAARQLHQLCAALLERSDPRLTEKLDDLLPGTSRRRGLTRLRTS
jgi:CRP-like cAMP-binding protein